jgi:hypothetical protein
MLKLMEKGAAAIQSDNTGWQKNVTSVLTSLSSSFADIDGAEYLAELKSEWPE